MKRFFCPFIRLLCTLLFATTGNNAFATSYHFIAPYSGKKVSSYKIDLPSGPGQRSTFEVPEKCSAVTETFDAGAARYGSRVDRSVWEKVIGDCRYFGFLNTFPQSPAEDFVSDYDFFNADFNDLPIRQNCNPTTDDTNCSPIPIGIRTLGHFLSFIPAPAGLLEPANSLCRFSNGLFRGRLIQTPDGLICQPDITAPGCRLLSVDRADVNGDGYQDAILQLVPLGASRGHTPIFLPVTRTAGDQKFFIPEGVVLPEMRPD